MMKCEHDLSERETACADGMCPLCLGEALIAASVENQSPDEIKGSYDHGLAAGRAESAAEIERLRAVLQNVALAIGAENYDGFQQLIDQQRQVFQAELRQPEEHRKNAEIKAQLDALSGHQQYGGE